MTWVKGLGHQTPHCSGHPTTAGAVALTIAEMRDRKWALQALQRCKPILAKVQSLLCDRGYAYKPFAQGVKKHSGRARDSAIARRSELRTVKVMHQGRVVERRFAWLEKYRLLRKS